MRLVVVAHRWLGAALAVILTVWFLSGIVMMYWSYPSVTQADRLRHAPTLDPRTVKLTVEQAFSGPGRERPRRVALSSFDGRPVYLGDQSMIYADDGSEQRTVDRGMVNRAAAFWTGRPAEEATVESIGAVDQWTLSGQLRTLRPLFRFSWPDGQQVYVDGTTAEVVQYTTRASRFWAYLGAIPHWLYVPALRTHDAAWLSGMIWASTIGAVASALGLAIAGWRYSPRRRYRYQGAPSSLPYRGWKRWHTVAGLAVGLVAISWTFSGLLSLEPFRLEERLTRLSVRRDPANDGAAAQAWSRMADLLLGAPVPAAQYASRPPASVIASLPDFEIKELEHASLAGEPVYLAIGHRETRIVPVRGATIDPQDLVHRVRAAAGPHAEVELIDAFDAYYRDRTGVLPLPVIRVRMKDSVGSRYYINPKTAMIVGSYITREWVSRWLYHGLHSMDFPWLYNHRPLWDVVVLTLLLGGAALCGTSLVLAWRVVARTLLRMTAALSAGAHSAEDSSGTALAQKARSVVRFRT